MDVPVEKSVTLGQWLDMLWGEGGFTASEPQVFTVRLLPSQVAVLGLLAGGVGLAPDVALGELIGFALSDAAHIMDTLSANWDDVWQKVQWEGQGDKPVHVPWLKFGEDGRALRVSLDSVAVEPVAVELVAVEPADV